MDDGTTLLAVLGAVYFLDCIVWTADDSLVLRESLPGRWWPLRKGALLPAFGLRAVVANPLPPIGGVTVVPEIPLALSPDGVGTIDPNTGLGTLILYDDLGRLSVEETALYLDRRLIARLRSEPYAQYVRQLLGQLRAATPRDRPTVVTAAISRMLDTEAIGRRAAQLRRETAALRMLCHVAFFQLFVYAPLLLWYPGLSIAWPFLVVPLLGFMILIGFEARRVQSLLYVDGATPGWGTVLPVMLAPPTAIRALDTVTRDAFCTFHPVAVASVLCSHAAFRSLASAELRRLRFHPGTRAEQPYEVAARWFRDRVETEVAPLVARRLGADLEALLTPVRRDDESQAYCPRCWAQFSRPTGVCSDCGGLALKPFAQVE